MNRNLSCESDLNMQMCDLYNVKVFLHGKTNN